MTRAKFRSALEAGIAHAHDILTPAEKYRLRALGYTADAIGTNFDRGPGCPLVLAGIASPVGGYTVPDRSLMAFWATFDNIAFSDIWRDVLPGTVRITG